MRNEQVAQSMMSVGLFPVQRDRYFLCPLHVHKGMTIDHTKLGTTPLISYTRNLYDTTARAQFWSPMIKVIEYKGEAHLQTMFITKNQLQALARHVLYKRTRERQSKAKYSSVSLLQYNFITMKCRYMTEPLRFIRKWLVL